MLTYEEIKKNNEITTYIKKGNDVLGEIGYTEHGFAHAGRVAEAAGRILELLEYPKRTTELAKIAAFMHDIGNCVNRNDHAQSGAIMAFRILSDIQADPEDIADIVSAIGNHDEGTGSPISPVSAALILADKSDVRRTRVRYKSRNAQKISEDIHDRVNYAVEKSDITILPQEKMAILSLTIDTEISPVMEYFEIFLSRMVLCRTAAEYLGLRFELNINNIKLL